MALWKKIIIGLVAIVVLIAIVGFFILPAVIKPIAIEKLSTALHRPVSIEKIGINPYALSVTIKGFKISEPAQSANAFVAFDNLYINLHGINSLFQRKLILEEIQLTKPYVNIVRKEDHSYNFSDLLPKEENKPVQPETKPFYFSLNNIQITGGSIDFRDDPYKTKHTVREMNLAIPAISNIAYLAKTYVEPKFSAKINDDLFELKGQTTPFLDSRETVFDINISDIDIPFYLKYVPVKMNFDLKSAKLDTRLKVKFIMQKGKEPDINIAGDVVLYKVVLDDRQNNKILRLPELKAAIVAAEPLNSTFHLKSISLKDIDLAVTRSKSGEINLTKLIETPQAEKKVQPKTAASPTEAKPAKPFNLVIDELQLDAKNLTFTDNVPARKVVVGIAPLNLKINNFSTARDAQSKIDLQLQVDKKGEIVIGGDLGITPLIAELNIGVKNLPIRTFQPYFSDKVKVNVQKGGISTDGKFSLAVKEQEPPRMKYAGKLFVSNVALVDATHANDFLQWKQLHFDSLQTGINPFFLDIKGVSLTDFFVRIIINADGTLNMQDIFGPEKKEAKTESAPQESEKKETEKKQTATQDGQQGNPASNIKIGAVTFQGGTIDFSDRFIKPNYSVRMLNMGGSVKGLSATESSRADVNLKGNLGYGSPIEIKGKINPLIKDLFADIKVDFRDIELSPVTPYSSKYLGHPIEKGKLTFAVEYFIDKRKLDAKNKILIDQLILGDKVESPQAVKAPVGLAVSLLKDRHGQINLDIPLSGSFDDPKFRIWPLIWQVIVNLLTKALTSPFALLSSLTGGGEELSYVEFDYGSSMVSETNLKKVATLTKALIERPQLKMDIEGYVDPENDKEGLKKASFERKLKVQKLKESTDKGAEAESIRQVIIAPDEYEKYLTLAYNAETFPKPRTAIGTQKKLPKEEMEKLMMANIAITESDLRQLALRRAQNIKELILKSGEVPSSRIFIIEPKTLAPEKKDKLKESRVNFKLK